MGVSDATERNEFGFGTAAAVCLLFHLVRSPRNDHPQPRSITISSLASRSQAAFYNAHAKSLVPGWVSWDGVGVYTVSTLVFFLGVASSYTIGRIAHFCCCFDLLELRQIGCFFFRFLRFFSSLLEPHGRLQLLHYYLTLPTTTTPITALFGRGFYLSLTHLTHSLVLFFFLVVAFTSTLFFSSLRISQNTPGDGWFTHIFC